MSGTSKIRGSSTNTYIAVVILAVILKGSAILASRQEGAAVALSHFAEDSGGATHRLHTNQNPYIPPVNKIFCGASESLGRRFGGN
jgi:hypothetical protein